VLSAMLGLVSALRQNSWRYFYFLRHGALVCLPCLRLSRRTCASGWFCERRSSRGVNCWALGAGLHHPRSICLACHEGAMWRNGLTPRPSSLNCFADRSQPTPSIRGLLGHEPGYIANRRTYIVLRCSSHTKALQSCGFGQSANRPACGRLDHINRRRHWQITPPWLRGPSIVR